MSLKETVTAALNRLGADASRFDFDDHNTIALAFDEVGDIFLDPTSEGVHLWGVTEGLDEQASPLLEETKRSTDYWASGTLALHKDGKVGGLLNSDVPTDPDRLAAALQDFHQALGRLHSTV